jgi:hypothetical protein
MACSPDAGTAPSTRSPALEQGGQNRVPTAVSASHAALVPNVVLAAINGVNVYHGGFGSALDQLHGSKDFYSLTDRGPNVAGSGTDKLFAVPEFHPQVGRFRLDHGQLIQEEVIVLKAADGTPLTGLPVGASGACGSTGEIPRALDGTLLPFDPNGIDSEGLRVMRDRSFWVSDEYGPFLTHFGPNGVTLERNSPCSGPHPIPAVLARRQANKGMEGLAAIDDGRTLVGIVQNPLDNPNHTAGKTSRFLRILFFNTETGATRQYLYPMDDPSYGASEIEAVSSTRFLVDERDGKFFNDPVSPSVQKRIYLIDVSGATDVSDPSNGVAGLVVNGKTIEQMTDTDLLANGIVPVRKDLVVDLLAFGYPHDKAEGLSLSEDGRTIAVSNDDDFGVTDDGNQHLIQKRLPSGEVDHNEIWFFNLSKSLKAFAAKDK